MMTKTNDTKPMQAPDDEMRSAIITTARVHGLANDWVAPDWPPLTLVEVDRLLRAFPNVRGAEAVLSHSPRPFSAASIVATPGGRVFVKRHHASVRDRDGLEEEHRFMRHLRGRGVDVPCVLADENGETAVNEGSWTYEVHSVADGIDLYERDLSWTPFHSAQHAAAAGRALARLHRAAEDYVAPARSARTLVSSFTIFREQDPWPALKRYVAERPELAAYLEKNDWRRKVASVLIPHHERFREYLPALGPLWTHNDFHASNLFWSSAAEDAEAVSIIDFGLADRTNAVHDLATAIERNGVQWLELEGSFERVVHLDHIEALLRGYEEVRPLSAEEALALPALLPLVHVEFALSEMDYFLRVLHSEERAFVAWDTYCLGHAAWFRSDAGKRLLAYLEGRHR